MAPKVQVTKAEYSQIEIRLAEVTALLQKAQLEKSEAHQSAGDPDMHENFAAEEADQRIRMWATEERRLKRQLAQVEIVDPTSVTVYDGTVQIGCTVVLILDETEQITKVLSGPQGRFDKGQIASTTDLGKAIVGKKAGYVVTYTTKSGDKTKVKIVEVHPPADFVSNDLTVEASTVVNAPISHHR